MPSLHQNSDLPEINSFQQYYADIKEKNQQLFQIQPCNSRDYYPGFCSNVVPYNNSKSSASSSSSSINIYEVAEVANLTQDHKKYRILFHCVDKSVHEFYWTNFYDYIQIQKIIAILKYQSNEIGIVYSSVRFDHFIDNNIP